MKRFLLSISLAAGTVLAVPAAMAGPPERFAIRTIISGLEEPTSIAYGPHGRVFITEKRGRVKVLAQGKVHEFLDLRDEVNHSDDRGLNNLIIDKRGRLYLFFTEELRTDDPDRRHPAGGRLLRITASARNPNRADPKSRVTLISGFDSHGPWHSVGGLDFDKKGNLVLAFGDGSSSHPKGFSAADLVTYDLDSLNGKVLRIDSESGYGIPTNPYFDADRPDSVRSKVIARGFRMPYRLVVDRVTGAIYVGDVGSDQYEEIDLVPVSAAEPDTELNYGWPCYEGGAEGEPVRRYPDESACVSNYYSAANERQLTKAPLYAYSAMGGAALVLGPFYRGGPYPEQFDGKLVFADWVRDRFWTYGDGEVADFGSEDWGAPAPTDIEVTPHGTIAYTAFSYNGNASTSGQVKEIVYLGRSGTVIAPWMLSALGASVVVLAFVYWKRRRRLR